MKKVLFISSYTYPYHAGGGLSAMNFARYLKQQSIETKILTLNRNFKLPTFSVVDDVRIARIPYLNQGYLLKMISMFIILPWYFFEILNAEMVIIYGGNIIAWESIPIFGRICRKRIIFRSTMYGEDDVRSLITKNKFLQGFRLYSLSNISGYFSLTPAFSESFEQMLGKTSKIIEIPQGVDTNRFYPINDFEKKNLRKKLNLPEHTFIIISVGALVIRKGYPQTFNVLSKLDIPFIYIILGDFDLSNENLSVDIVRKAEEIYKNGNEKLGKKVLFKGFVDNVQEYLQAADLYITASKREGLSNALLEAMACGLPLLLRDLNYLDGYILGENQNCIFFKSPEEFSDGVLCLYNEPNTRKKFGMKASMKIRENFSYQDIANRLGIFS